MKKLFSIFAAALFATSLFAAEVTIVPTDVTDIASGTTGEFTRTLQGFEVTWNGAYYNDATQGTVDLRVYAEGKMSLTAPASAKIQKVEVIGYVKKGFKLVVNAGTITTGSAEFTAETTKDDWADPLFVVEDIDAESVTFTCNKQVRFMGIRITYEDAKPEPVADGFYLLDNSFDWELQYGALLDPNMGTKGEYMVRMYLEPTFDYEMKVVRVEGGEIAQWYPEGEGNNMVPDETGDVTLYFRPEGNTVWPQNFIYVTKAPEHYYLVGDFTDWELDTDYEFELNAGVGVEEWHLEMQLPTAEWLEKDNSDIKVIGVIGDATDKSNWIWFPAGEGNNMTPENYGIVDIYFRPQGNPDWANTFAYVAEHVTVTEFYLLSDLTDPAWEKQEAKQFVPVEDMEGIFVLNTKLQAGEHLKGGIYADGALFQMLPGSGDEDYCTVDADHAGDMIIYLSLTFVDEWNTEFPAGGGFLMIEKAPDFILPSAARELALSGYTDEAVIQGIVTSVADWYEAKANIDFWMADELCDGNVFKAYRVACASAADAPKKGDLVRVTGNLTVYKSTPETAEGGSFEIKEAGSEATNIGAMSIYEAIDLHNCLDTVILTGAVTNIAMDKDDASQYNAYGNFDLIGIDGDLGKVYVYGLLNAAGEKGKFREMGVDSADTLTIKAVLSTFTDTEGNVKNEAVDAVYVEHREFVAPPTDGFYLIGERSDWKIENDLLLERNLANTEVEEYMIRAFLNEGEEFKVVKVEGGEKVAWYPGDGEDNLTSSLTGDVMIYFQPEGNTEWPMNFVYLDGVWSYYLVGDFNDWTVGQPDCWMELNVAADAEEYALHFNLPTAEELGKDASEIKVVGVAAGKDDKWFPAENVTPEAYGEVVVYFRPEGGMADWVAGQGYIFVAEEAEEEFINCEQAVALAAAEIADPTAANETVEGGPVVVRGFVITPFDVKNEAPSRKAMKQSAWIADDKDAKQGTVQIYLCEIEQELKKGDLVEVTGTLAKFKKSSGDIVIEVIKGSVEVLGGGEGEDIDVVCEDLEVYDYTAYYGFAVLTGSTTDYDVEAYLYPDEEATSLYGDYTEETAEIYLINPADEEDYVTVTVTEASFKHDETLGDVFEGVGLGDDGNLYTVNMRLVIPEPVGTQAITFETLGQYAYYGSTGDWYYEVEDEGVAFFNTDIYSDDRAGVFEGDDVELGYTQLGLVSGTDTTRIAFYNLKVTITENEAGEGLVVAEGLGKDAILYTIIFGYQVVKPTETKEVVDENASLNDYTEMGLGVIVQGTQDDIMISLHIITDEIGGEFTFKDLNLDYGYSFVKDGEEYYMFVDGNFAIAVDGYVVTITGELLAANTVNYKFTLTANIEPMAIENANGENQVTKTLRNGQLIINVNGAEYNVVGARVK